MPERTFPRAGNQKTLMTIKSTRRGIVAPPARRLQIRSSLVRRLVRARDDPAKQRIRAWLGDLDDRKLYGLGLMPEDIAAIRGSQSRHPALYGPRSDMRE